MVNNMLEKYRVLMRGSNTMQAKQAERVIIDFLLEKLQEYRLKHDVSDLEIQRRFGLGSAVICKMGPIV